MAIKEKAITNKCEGDTLINAYINYYYYIMNIPQQYLKCSHWPRVNFYMYRKHLQGEHGLEECILYTINI